MGFRFVVAFLCHGSNFPVAIEVLRHFDALHGLWCFSDSFGWRVKSLTIHLALPTLGCTKEKDVDDFIGRQTLSVVERRWTTSNLLGVDATDMHDVLFHTHIHGLSRFTSQALLDMLECFVGQEILDNFVQ